MNKDDIRKILVISLTNLGDVILSFPVIDILKENFPGAELSVVVGPKARDLFQGNPHIQNVYIFNKQQSGFKKFSWVMNLRKEKFDFVIDLRNTAIPFFLNPKYRTSSQVVKSKAPHMRQKHLNRLNSFFLFPLESKNRYALSIVDDVRRSVDALLQAAGAEGRKFVVVSPGAANQFKRWTPEGFAAVCDELICSLAVKIVFVGDRNDCDAAAAVAERMKESAVNLCGKTSLLELADLLRRSFFVIANDSAVMHLASYCDIPTIAIFGPTDPRKYGPWSSRRRVVRKELFCSPCEKSGCAYDHECMKHLSPSEVLKAVREICGGENS